VSCSNDRATIGSYTILLLQSSSSNIPSYSWPNQSSDMAKWSSRGTVLKCCFWRTIWARVTGSEMLRSAQVPTQTGSQDFGSSWTWLLTGSTDFQSRL